MRVYDGENLKETDPKAKSVQEYRDAAGVDEGMTGVSTRFAFKILSQTFNYDTKEVAADPVHLMYILEQAIKREQFPKETEAAYLDFIKSELATRYAEFIGHEIQKAYLESYSEYGQNLFDRYIAYADAWIEDQDFKDPDTGQILNREVLDSELSQIEKPAGIANPKDFRNEVVKFTLRARARNNGRNPSWTSYEKLREVIEKRMFGQVEDLLPVISFGSKKDSVTEKQHAEFVQRMIERGYTEATGPAAGGLVHAREQGGLKHPRRWTVHAELHRSPAEPEGQEPRQPPALPEAGARGTEAEHQGAGHGPARSPTSTPSTPSRCPRGAPASRASRTPRDSGRRAACPAWQQGIHAGRPHPEAGPGRRRQGSGDRRSASPRTISVSCCRARRCSTCSSRISSFPTWSSSISRRSSPSSRAGPASPRPAPRPTSMSGAPCATAMAAASR